MLINENSSICLSLYTKLRLKDKKIGEKVIKAIFDYSEGICPEVFDNHGQSIPINSKDYDSLIDYWVKAQNIILKKESDIQSEIAISKIYERNEGYNTLLYWVSEEFFNESLSIDIFLQLSKALYQELKPDFGSIHQTRNAIDMATINHESYGKTVVPVNLKKGIPNIYWANFFGPSYIKLKGMKNLDKAPSYENLELVDGGRLLLSSPSPLYPQSEKSQEGRLLLRKFIGEKKFYKWP